MGHVYVKAKVGELQGEKVIDLELLVHTRATHMCLSAKLATELGLKL